MEPKLKYSFELSKIHQPPSKIVTIDDDSSFVVPENYLKIIDLSTPRIQKMAQKAAENILEGKIFGKIKKITSGDVVKMVGLVLKENESSVYEKERVKVSSDINTDDHFNDNSIEYEKYIIKETKK